MKINKLNISDLIDLFKGNIDKSESSATVNNYLMYRINNKLECTEDELKELEMFVEKLKKFTHINKVSKEKIFSKVEKLLILSKDSTKFDNFISLDKKKVDQLTEEEILEYLDILINNCSCCISLSRIQDLIKQYLEISNEVDKISDIVCNNMSLFSKNDMKKLSDNITNIILKAIIKELDSKTINSKKLEQHLKQLVELNIEKMSTDNILLIRDILQKIDDNKLLTNLDDISIVQKLTEKINDVFGDLIDNVDNETQIKNDIISGNIVLTNSIPKSYVSNLNLNFDDLPIVEGERIITIDDPLSSDLDGAFSIQKVDGIYILNVYVSDVPSFLMKNRKLCEYAYLRGTSMYAHMNNNVNYNIDMLPPFISHKYVSLNLGYVKNVIAFNFVIGEDGEIYSSSVSRQRIKVTDKLSPEQAKEMINSEQYYGLLQEDLRNYKQLCKVVSEKSNDEYLKQLSCDGIYDLIGFPSILVNYYIGHEAEFAIYRKSGIYTQDSSSYYTHSMTPIRKFVSNINLAFFLEQQGVMNFPNKDLRYVENNVKEIIEHLNYREQISKVIEKNSQFVKKYIK